MILDRLQRRWLIENVARNVAGKRVGPCGRGKERRSSSEFSVQFGGVRFSSANEDKIRL